jgi:hypothetical protein
MLGPTLRLQALQVKVASGFSSIVLFLPKQSLSRSILDFAFRVLEFAFVIRAIGLVFAGHPKIARN